MSRNQHLRKSREDHQSEMALEMAIRKHRRALRISDFEVIQAQEATDRRKAIRAQIEALNVASLKVNAKAKLIPIPQSIPLNAFVVGKQYDRRGKR